MDGSDDGDSVLTLNLEEGDEGGRRRWCELRRRCRGIT